MLSVMPAPIFILLHDWIVMNFIRNHFSMEGGTRQHVYGPVWVRFLIPRDASCKMTNYTMSIASKNILGTQNYLVFILSHDKQLYGIPECLAVASVDRFVHLAESSRKIDHLPRHHFLENGRESRKNAMQCFRHTSGGYVFYVPVARRPFIKNIIGI